MAIVIEALCYAVGAYSLALAKSPIMVALVYGLLGFASSGFTVFPELLFVNEADHLKLKVEMSEKDKESEMPVRTALYSIRAVCRRSANAIQGVVTGYLFRTVEYQPVKPLTDGGQVVVTLLTTVFPAVSYLLAAVFLYASRQQK